MRLWLALAAAVVSNGLQQPPNPPGREPPASSQPMPKDRAVPAWANSRLEVTRADFRRVREEIHGKFGLLPRSSFVDPSYSEAAYRAYSKSKQPVDAFRTLYLWRCTGDSSAPVKFEQLWAALPTNEYEVARLHFLWAAPYPVNNATPLGERLLAKIPKTSRCWP
jgi:hypothetical protein